MLTTEGFSLFASSTKSGVTVAAIAQLARITVMVVTTKNNFRKRINRFITLSSNIAG
jgi:hypothetical protein